MSPVAKFVAEAVYNMNYRRTTTLFGSSKCSYLSGSVIEPPQGLCTHAVYTVCLFVNKCLRQYLWTLLFIGFKTLFFRLLADYCNKWQAI